MGTPVFKFPGPVLNPVDAEQEIEKRPDEWKHQAYGNPAKGRLRGFFEKQGMPCSGQGERYVESEDYPFDRGHVGLSQVRLFVPGRFSFGYDRIPEDLINRFSCGLCGNREYPAQVADVAKVVRGSHDQHRQVPLRIVPER